MISRKSYLPTLMVLTVCGVGRAALADLTGTAKLAGDPLPIPELKAIANDQNCKKMHKNPVYDDSLVVGDNGELTNVVISITANKGKPFTAAVPTAAAVLDQEGCMYVPHVVACMVGQAVEAKSGDACTHNVHSLSVDNPGINFAESKGVKKLAPFIAIETFRVKCDLHPWMSAWVRVLDNPYFAVTDEKGEFKIDTKGIPDGEYTVVAWHEKFQDKPLEQKVTFKDGGTDKPLQFTFKLTAK